MRPTGGTNSDINVTPLVDVVLVLLIIFMVVTPLLEKDIPVRTPNSEKVEEVTEVPPDQIVVYVNKGGDMRINSESVAAEEFVGKLKGALASKVDSRPRRVHRRRRRLQLRHASSTSSTARGKREREVLGFATDRPDPVDVLVNPVTPRSRRCGHRAT